jgi:ketosteroid isomerase-like protein
MKKVTLLSVFIYFFSILNLGCGSAATNSQNGVQSVANLPTDQNELDELKSEIKAINTIRAVAASSNDLLTILDYYADDIVCIREKKQTLIGKDEVINDSETWFEKYQEGYGVIFETAEVFGSNQLLTEIGKMIIKDKRGIIIDTINYMAIWKKTEGKWLCIREIKNFGPDVT